MESFD